MRRAAGRRIRFFSRLVVIGAMVGIVYGAITGVVFGLLVFERSVVSAIDGIMISAPIAASEMFLLRSRWGRPLRQAPFLVTFTAKWLIYAAIIAAVVIGGPGARIVGETPFNPALAPALMRLGFAFSVVAAMTVVFLLELGQIVGLRNLRNIVLGRYHRPRVEERFFLFIDIVGSTSLAERLDPAAVHHFLATVFRLASDPIADHGGEIYQYVGDEIVVTWTMAEARGDAPPLACFFAVAGALEKAAPEFDRDFGAAPRLRAALHAGTVISGEIGETKRDIVFHGDVMNTAARLEQATRDLERRFLASADALGRLTGTGRYKLTPLGPQKLRGRTEPIVVYAVEAA